MAEQKKKKQEAETAVVPVTQTFNALQSIDDLKEVVEANFGHRAASVFDLERIGVGTGGTIAYNISDELEGDDVVKEFEAMIAFWTDKRAYWVESYEDAGGGSPPDCSSEDMVRGIGSIPGDENSSRLCETCPMNQFGSDPREGGRGKACREMISMFLLRQGREDRLFPSMLIVPPTSLQPVSRYMMALTSRGLPYYGALHRFTLERDRNAAGLEFSKVKMGLVRMLSPEEKKAVKAYSDAMRPTFERVKPDYSDVAG